MYVTLSQYPMENIMDDWSLYRLQTVIYHQKKEITRHLILLFEKLSHHFSSKIFKTK